MLQHQLREGTVILLEQDLRERTGTDPNAHLLRFGRVESVDTDQLHYVARVEWLQFAEGGELTRAAMPSPWKRTEATQ